ncbi:hypothetical protein N780_01910 [Pontibacillus chungwhensis BH030062]|uniref:NIPSNAP domain-containing protein n=1 Tax=Pontibacillus chungwhensis BH030062 TaxID=1385513 RepID=A0A0A2VFC3_9BACI|nr:DUF6176 family protein [Pontibacillus chungwhensis]KGP92315.1 hypothetical protein N780_01910 [Pontibacillus chungwhensis BH030062]
MTVELTRFRVKEGKSERVDEWLKFLNDNMKDVLVTLEGEKMYVETIFREHLNGEEFLYWYSVQGKDGQEVDQSEHWIDQRHLEFWDECIDETFKPKDLKTEVVMIPQRVRDSMNSG